MYSDIHQEIERCLNEKLKQKEIEKLQALRLVENGGAVQQNGEVTLPRVHLYFLLFNFCIIDPAD